MLSPWGLSSAKTIPIIGTNFASLTLAACLRKKGFPVKLYDLGTSRKPPPQYVVLDHKSCQPLLEVLDVSEAQFRQQVEDTPGSFSNSESRPWENLGLFRARGDKFRDLLTRDVDIELHGPLVGAKLLESGLTELSFKDDHRISGSFIVGGDHQNHFLLKCFSRKIRYKDLPVATISCMVSMPEAEFRNLYLKLLQGTGWFLNVQGLTLQAWVRAHSLGETVHISLLYSRAKKLREADLLFPIRHSFSPIKKQDIFNEELRAISSLIPKPMADLLSLVPKTLRLQTFIKPFYSYLCDRSELLRLGKSGLVFIGRSAHATYDLGPLFGADSTSMAIEDGLALAQHVEEKGPTPDAIQSFYDRNYDKWKAEIESNEEQIIQIHQRTEPLPETPESLSRNNDDALDSLEQIQDREGKAEALHRSISSRRSITERDVPSQGQKNRQAGRHANTAPHSNPTTVKNLRDLTHNRRSSSAIHPTTYQVEQHPPVGGVEPDLTGVARSEKALSSYNRQLRVLELQREMIEKQMEIELLRIQIESGENNENGSKDEVHADTGQLEQHHSGPWRYRLARRPFRSPNARNKGQLLSRQSKQNLPTHGENDLQASDKESASGSRNS